MLWSGLQPCVGVFCRVETLSKVNGSGWLVGSNLGHSPEHALQILINISPSPSHPKVGEEKRILDTRNTFVETVLYCAAPCREPWTRRPRGDQGPGKSDGFSGVRRKRRRSGGSNIAMKVVINVVRLVSGEPACWSHSTTRVGCTCRNGPRCPRGSWRCDYVNNKAIRGLRCSDSSLHFS